MSEYKANLGMTQNKPDLQPAEAWGLSKEEMHGLSADVDRGFKAFAKRIGLEPHEVGYMPARNPEGYRTKAWYPHNIDSMGRVTTPPSILAPTATTTLAVRLSHHSKGMKSPSIGRVKKKMI